MANNRLGSALRLLASRGFSSTGNRAGCRSFEGVLACSLKPVRVRLEISDWDFLSYPRIKILERPEHLPALLPHVDTGGILCYFSPGSVILDRYDPATALSQCIDQASAVLNQIATDPEYRKQDIENEFLAHWGFDQKIIIWPVLMGSIDSTGRFSNYFILGSGYARKAMIADKPDEVAAIALSLGVHPPTTSKCKCWLFRTSLFPAVTDESLPQTVKQLFVWLKAWDANLYNGIQRILEYEQDYLKYSFITFAVDSPVGWIGFGFNLDLIPHKAANKTPGKRGPKLYKQHLHGKGGCRSIFRLGITDISPRFVHNRNLAFPDLYDKRVAMIGCGAIGGYLAQSLVRLGVGTGKRGRLLLVDDDLLEPDNLGRHYLGYSSLFKHKAIALCDELKRQFPLCQITAKTENVRPISDRLFDVDLLIDATGEEAVSEMLNEFHILKRPKAPPMLYVWIKGNGEAVQALWVDIAKYGCFRCLRIPDPNRYREERFKLLNAEPERRFLGCRAFTPYAVSSPINAAGLATDVIIDWLKGDPSPRFRTRSIENADVRQVRNQNMSPLDGCPACRQS